MAQLAEYNETNQGGPRKHSSLPMGTADGPYFKTQIPETSIQGAQDKRRSVVVDLQVSS